MSFRQYTDRNREMLAERERGSSLEDLARKYGLRRTTVKALLVSERNRRSFQPMPYQAQQAAG